MKKNVLLLLLLFTVTGCATGFHHDYASGHYSSTRQQCVPYAREVSGIQLYGDAYSWWNQAQGRYLRGHQPTIGAVLVLKKTLKMPAGHVAVVKEVLDRRTINVTHSNWASSWGDRHIIYDSMRVDDVSQANDWTRVRFWNDDKNVFGFPYEAYGFIYP